jgi:hypothetical protein
MKISTLVIGLTIAVMTVAPATAQQSLGDVAGSIKLKRPEGDSVVIDQDSVGKARRRPIGGTEGEFFLDALGDCLNETTVLHDLLVEARGGEAFYRDEWRGRVHEVALELDGLREELGLVFSEGRYQEAYELAGYGSDTVGDALEILRDALANDRPVFSEARKLSEEAIRVFKEAQAAFGVASRADAAEKTPPLINPIEADRVMTALCGGRYSEGSSGFEGCIAQQRAALDAMTSRSGPGVGLDEAPFNFIRNNCRFEWPKNYAHQDRCERTRIAAKKERQ